MRSLTFRVTVLSAAALFVPLLVPLATNRVFTLNDLGAQNVPLRYIFASALHNGDSVLWTPALFAGYYIFGEGQTGIAHPWHIFLYRFVPFTLAFNVELVSSYIAMFAGMLVLLRHVRLSREARWVGAMVFTFSSYNLFHLIHMNAVAVVAHIPWILAATRTTLTATDPRRRAAASLAVAGLLASQILIGHPQHVWFGLLAVAAMCVYRLWERGALTPIALLAVAITLGTLIGAVQLLPLVDVVSASERSNWSADASTSFSLLPSNIIQLWLPSFFMTGVTAIPRERFAIHEFVVYNGALCTVALAWIAARWRALRDRPMVPALLLAAALALVLAFGRYAGLYAALAWLPGFKWFRAPARHLMLFDLALSVLAAIAFDDLLNCLRRGERIAWRRLWPLAVPAALSVVSAAAGSIAAHAQIARLSGASANAPWVALFLVVPLLFALSARGRSWAVPLLVVLTAVEMGYSGFGYVMHDPTRPMLTIEQEAGLVPGPAESRPGDLIALTEDRRPDDVLVLRGLRVWPGYLGLPPALAVTGDAPESLAERLAGAKWRISRNGRVQPISNAASRARLVTRVKVARDPVTGLQGLDVDREAVVAQPIGDLSGTPGVARVVSDRPGRIVVETSAPGRQLLVLTERFHSGWRMLDEPRTPEGGAARSEDARPLRVDGDYLGSVVDGGTHVVTFSFEPPSFRIGLWLTVLGLVLWAGALAMTVFGPGHRLSRTPTTADGSDR
jgi:hypothetical protein